MKTKKIILSALLLATSCIGINAHDFSATVNGQKIYFEIISKIKHTAQVTYKGSISDNTAPEISGTVEIPAKVKHDSIIYDIVAIGPKAFSGATELKSITLPAGITSIGDFAFEGCSSLNSVIFPGNDIETGVGAFFKCKDIQNVTIGSDWKSLDLAMFRWSDSLKNINIPAKVERISNLKKLKYLESINVDANNGKFASHDGILYNKNATILYGVPRGYAGKIKIIDGTTTITPDALIDCPNVTQIDIPATVASMSFKETSRMKNLKFIILRSESPMTNAYLNGIEMLAFQVANTDVEIIVPDSSKKSYKEALAQEEGEYTETNTPGSIPFILKPADMPKSKNIKGVKNFNNLED